LNAVVEAINAKDGEFNDEQKEELSSFAGELETAASEIEGVEFPGMY